MEHADNPWLHHLKQQICICNKIKLVPVTTEKIHNLPQTSGIAIF